jgi:hypothetical protein
VLKNENRQHKVIKDSAQLSAERYLMDNAKITVPKEDYTRHKEYWGNQLRKGDPAAKDVLKKLEPALSSKASVTLKGGVVEKIVNATSADRKEAKERLQRTADYKLKAEARGMQAAAHASEVATRAGIKAGTDLLFYAVNRITMEIREHWLNPGAATFDERLSELMVDLKSRFGQDFKRHGIGQIRSKIKSAAVDFVKTFFRDFYQALKKGGEYLGIICRELWGYVAGKTKSFSDVIVSVTKALSALAVVGVCAKFGVYLKSIQTPDFLVVLLTGFLSAVLTVSIFRLIDKTAQAVISILAATDIAKMRREQIDDLCAETFPVIDQQQAEFDSLIRQEERERRAAFDDGFAAIQSAIDEESIEEMVAKFQRLYGHFDLNLPFSSRKEFDDFMIDDGKFVL